ncbi:proline-rich protein HaeIII subfamily 1-like [Odocoileus virginianus]|uniref:Proline-rich protein HaeIII subfamily 1-like n=1 Tax=Odocoileus virginianus TaxID=9874 RepID=A0ABM4HIS9_ODOVR
MPGHERARGRARRAGVAGQGQAQPLARLLAFPLCPRPSPPRHKDPGPPGAGRVTEPPAGGVAATPPRAHPQRPRPQLRPRPRPAPPPGELLFLRWGGSPGGGSGARPPFGPATRGPRAPSGLRRRYPDRRFCRPFVSVFEAFPWPSSLAGKRAEEEVESQRRKVIRLPTQGSSCHTAE